MALRTKGRSPRSSPLSLPRLERIVVPHRLVAGSSIRVQVDGDLESVPGSGLRFDGGPLGGQKRYESWV